MKSLVRDSLNHIGNISTCHGIVDFCQSRQKEQISQQICWGLSLVSAFGAIIYYFVVLTSTYIANPTATKISQITVESLAFPNVTVCTMKQFSSKNFLAKWATLAPFFVKKLGTTSDPFDFGGWVLGVTGPTNIELDLNPVYVKLLETQFQLAFNKSVPGGLKWDVQDFIRSTATQCSELFSTCKFAAKPFNCCANANPIVSSFGVCYQLKSQPRHSSNPVAVSVNAGSGGGLIVELLHNFSDIPSFPIANYSQNGFHLSIGPYFSLLNSDTVSIASGLYAYVSLSPVFRVLSSEGSCTRSHVNIGPFNDSTTYSQSLCQGQCYYNATKQMFGCHVVGPYVAVPSSDVCSPLVAQKAIQYIVDAGDPVVDARLLQCTMYNCSQLCETWSYPPSVTYNNIIPTAKYLSDKGTEVHMITVVQIYFQQIAYTKMEEQLLMDFSTYISSVGGALGLFAGMSILTFVQCCAAFICMPISNLKGKQRVETERKINEKKTTAPKQSQTDLK